jgi:hypothetical protein
MKFDYTAILSAARFIGDGCALELEANVYLPQARTGN